MKSVLKFVLMAKFKFLLELSILIFVWRQTINIGTNCRRNIVYKVITKNVAKLQTRQFVRDACKMEDRILAYLVNFFTRIK